MTWLRRRRSRCGRVALAVLALLALVALSACGTDDSGADQRAGQQPQGASLRITLGTQAFPEARVLGELWRQALAVNGFTVDLRKGIGPAADLDAALLRGEIDGHVAYTGTVLSVVAHQEVSGLDPEQTYQRAQAFYAGRGLAMSARTPFENKDAVATTVQFAQDHRLETMGDLRAVPDLTFGARPEFQGLYLGLLGLDQRYGVRPTSFRPVELGQQYAALDDGSVDAVDAFTTDPQLRGGGYRVLADPELLFGSQNVVMTVRQDKLDSSDGAQFVAVVSAVNEELTQEAVVDMNAAVTAGQRDEEVARRFLQEHDLLRQVRG